jgi:regulator of protease activity HflC (stomatin/prohibitin superfamily)
MSLFTVTVRPHERVLEQVAGRPTRTLEPGRHRKHLRASYLRLDVRSRLLAVAPQDLLTADGVTIKVSAVVRVEIVDPVRHVETTLDPFAEVYLAVQVALREAFAAYDADVAVRSARREVTDAVTDAARAAGRDVGVDVREVVVKDVVLPADLRNAYADLVTGRQRAQAQLEAARAETAVLRSLANGAKLLDEHPALARIRLVQALPYGTSVHLGSRDLLALE